ncbi:hypothetical protein GJ744_007957 [Endocarpon pusillum]|uniref:Uncharacterized protein n=1 Tax=Endocarpon pusillum TaxID=364733 RepID=A0A8H7AMC4_9EURO|nr:hypothetical protein GJ744_007957 [Endocarpon pusillum]
MSPFHGSLCHVVTKAMRKLGWIDARSSPSSHSISDPKGRRVWFELGYEEGVLPTACLCSLVSTGASSSTDRHSRRLYLKLGQDSSHSACVKIDLAVVGIRLPALYITAGPPPC